jgi:hypothetical protein
MCVAVSRRVHFVGWSNVEAAFAYMVLVLCLGEGEAAVPVAAAVAAEVHSSKRERERMSQQNHTQRRDGRRHGDAMTAPQSSAATTTLGCYYHHFKQWLDRLKTKTRTGYRVFTLQLQMWKLQGQIVALRIKQWRLKTKRCYIVLRLCCQRVMLYVMVWIIAGTLLVLARGMLVLIPTFLALRRVIWAAKVTLRRLCH